MNNFNILEHEIKTNEQFTFTLFLTTSKAAERYIDQGRIVPNYLLAIDNKETLEREIHGVYIRQNTTHMIGKLNDLLDVSSEYSEAEKSNKLKIMHNIGLIGH